MIELPTPSVYEDDEGFWLLYGAQDFGPYDTEEQAKNVHSGIVCAAYDIEEVAGE